MEVDRQNEQRGIGGQRSNRGDGGKCGVFLGRRVGFGKLKWEQNGSEGKLTIRHLIPLGNGLVAARRQPYQ